MSKRSAAAMTSGDPFATPASAPASTASAAPAYDPSKRVRLADVVADMTQEYAGKGQASSGGEAEAAESAAAAASRPLTAADIAEDDLDAILQLVDQAPEVAELDADGARSLLQRLAKAVSKNLEMRERHPDEPNKFMDSELQLDEALTAVNQLSASPHLMPLLLEPLGGASESALDTLCSLVLSHENVDVSLAALRVLAELVDAEELSSVDDAAPLQSLVDYLTGASTPAFLTTMVRALDRFPARDAQEESEAVGVVFGVLENLTDLQPREVAQRLVQHTGILQWIVKRLRDDAAFNSNKLAASELLSIILTSAGAEGQRQMGEVILEGTGIKQLIKLLAAYRKQDPANDEEIEYVENLFDVLCLCLTNHSANQSRFAAASGIELMLTLIRRNTYAKAAAFKCLDYACLRSPPNCESLIDLGGLKLVFGALMQAPSNRKERAAQTATEEHLLEIISQLFLHVTDVRYLRLRRKFEEQDNVKVERVVELLVKYQQRIDEAEAKKQRDTHSSAAATEDGGDDEDEVEKYLRQCEVGLTHVGLASIILAFLATSGEKQLHTRIAQLLHQHDRSFRYLQQTVAQFAAMIEAKEGDDVQMKTKAVLQTIAGMLADEKD